MPTDTDVFERLRPRLLAIGYRMLASVHEAEDLVQDAWMRWHERGDEARAEVLNAEAWLVTMTTRMAIDRLRAAKQRRESYVGHWLPEPLPEDSPATPEQAREYVDDVSVAFLVMLDRLSPEARAAFLLREVFDADYDQVAELLGKTEAAARQVVHRARRELDKAREAGELAPALPARHGEQRELLLRFVQAVSRGDFAALQSMLADGAQLFSDGGGIVPSFGVPLVGAARIAQLYYASHLKNGGAMRIELARLNGRWALLRYIDGALESAQAFETDGQRILRVHVQRNPDKLARLPQR